NGTAVTAPTTSSTTFGSLTTIVANEFDAIASALSLTAPSSTTNVAVLTPSDGTAIYTINLSSSSGHAKTPISVDANGNPVGNEVVPFSTLPTALQQQFITDAPSGVTLTSASTKPVQVAYVDGVQTYTVVFKTVGTTTTITLNGSGALTSLPSQSVTEFSDIPAAAQTELQTLATADGAGTISTTQKVKAFTEANGTTIYTVRIKTTSGDTTLTISSDEDGNATVPPQDGPGPGGPPPGGPGGGPGGMPGGCGQNNSSSSESSSGDSDSSSSSSDSTTTTESTSSSSTSDDSGSTDSGSSDDGNGPGTGKGPGGHGPPPPPPPHGR
ncbi:MAG TPA: hypothetical protein VL992_17815, partial [Tepidisphaeraceae bacterium]|nr:hypothetical protein [Tepidisphaeraceae bacterium]